jgi:DNA-directed RNA polymerase subunit RPC12/RpoP
MTDTSSKEFFKQGEVYPREKAYGHLAEDHKSPRKADETEGQTGLQPVQPFTHQTEKPPDLTGGRGFSASPDITRLIEKINSKKGGAKGSKNGNWKGGVAEYPDHYQMKLIRKQRLIEESYTCQVCGKFAKEIHHKDETKTNHAKENIMVVCRSCHFRIFHRDRGQGRKKLLYSGCTIQQIADASGYCYEHTQRLLRIIPALHSIKVNPKIAKAIEELKGNIHTHQITPALIHRNHKHQRQVVGINSL